jgi:hypothetical protein
MNGIERISAERKRQYEHSTDEKPESCWVICLSCYATGGPGGTKKEAAENWNRRSL